MKHTIQVGLILISLAAAIAYKTNRPKRYVCIASREMKL